MALRSILVSLDDPNDANHVLKVAIPLAQANDAHLTGVHISAPLEVPSRVVAEIPSETLEENQQHRLKNAAEIKSLFESVVDGAGITADWCTPETREETMGEPLTRLARCSDLVIVSQDSGDRYPGTTSPAAANLLIHGGRPLLFVPTTGQNRPVGDHILVAWDASREAARAIFDALPMLRNAKSINILLVNPDSHFGSNRPSIVDDIAESLGRHGIEAETVFVNSNGRGTGATLLSFVEDHACDLLVMGGYGHSRFREFALGGVTRHVLGHMKIPVLMSH